MSTKSKPVAVSELESIAQVMEEYIDCGRIGNPDKSDIIFHPDAIMYGYNTDGSFTTGSWSQFKGFVRECGSLPEMKARIDIIAVTPTTAVVKLDMEKSPSGPIYTDFHTLIRFDGKWKIIAKVFHEYELQMRLN